MTKILKNVFLIKALNSCYSKDILDTEYCKKKILNNTEVTLYLDLNILTNIHRFILYQNNASLKEYIPSPILDFEGWKVVNELINFLNDTSEIFLAPSYALAESAANFQQVNFKAYEFFLATYLPKFRNAYDMLEYNKHSLNNKEHKFYLYLCEAQILLIHYIHKFYQKLSPLEKFKLFINRIVLELWYFDRTLITIALYSFLDKKDLPTSVKIMLDNFIKKSADPEKTYKNSLNSAHDLFYYRSIINWEIYGLKNNLNPTQECWLVTADKGIKALSEILNFTIDSKTYDLSNLIPQNANAKLFAYFSDANNYSAISQDKVNIVKKTFNFSEEEIVSKIISNSKMLTQKLQKCFLIDKKLD